MKETRRMTWKEYDLIQPTTDEPYPREITWNVFNEKANRFANMLLSRGVKKGGQSGDPDVQLSGMAPHLFWGVEDRGTGRPV